MPVWTDSKQTDSAVHPIAIFTYSLACGKDLDQTLWQTSTIFNHAKC